jgi:hypothetical protein
MREFESLGEHHVVLVEAVGAMQQVTGIEFLSKTRNTYDSELSFANKGLKLNTEEDGQ